VSNRNTRVVVAMSGGVDSSVSAALLVEQGYDAVGVMMRLWAEEGGPDSPPNRCCTPDQMADARRVADILDIPFYVVDMQEPFKRHVVDFYLDSYREGVTPNPCLACNRHIRFTHLLQHALALDGDYLATGHYARVRRTDAGLFELLKGKDSGKDQGYVLSVLRQDQLARAMFPVGDYTKLEARALAEQFGLPVASKGDSQDLCFLADGDYRRFLRDHTPNLFASGPIVNQNDEVLGQHTGLPNYTIGQRKGLGIAASEPLYVLKTDPARNALVVGYQSELGDKRLIAEKVNWIAGQPPEGTFRAGVKIRYKAREAPANIMPVGEDNAEVVFDEPVRDATPGQGAVFYDGERVLGGGVIVREAAA
jgi:tRNA-specific 2-thiouridylase